MSVYDLFFFSQTLYEIIWVMKPDAGRQYCEVKMFYTLWLEKKPQQLLNAVVYLECS